MLLESAASRERRILAEIEIEREEDKDVKPERETGVRLVWIDDGEVVRGIPVAVDPITALRGSGQGKALLEKLLQDRRKDRERGS